MADAIAERGGAGVQWVLKSGILIIMLAVVQVRVTGKQFEKIRHNRLSPFLETRHRFLSRYHPADLGKNEYKTVKEGTRSRFPNLDRLYNSLHQTKRSRVATPAPQVEASGAPMWAPTSENPLLMAFDLDLDQTLGDDFQVDDFPETTVKSTSSTVSH